ARTVEHAHGTLHLDGEVHVAGGVDDVEAVLRVGQVHALPEAGGGGRRDRDAALLLLLHPVHGGGAVVHFTDLVVHAGVEQDALGRGGLASVDVRGNADVAVTLEGRGAGHGNTPERFEPATPDGGLRALGSGGSEGVDPDQKRKWLKALLASAMRCTSSRRFIAPPRPSVASISSLARRMAMDFSLRFLAASLIQRIDSARRRTGRTSTGTW